MEHRAPSQFLLYELAREPTTTEGDHSPEGYYEMVLSRFRTIAEEVAKRAANFPGRQISAECSPLSAFPSVPRSPPGGPS